MKRIALLYVLVLAQCIVMAGTLEGTVLDEDRQPLELASVMAFSDTTFVNGTATDANGTFKFEDVDSITKLCVSYLGYETVEINLSAYDGHPLTVEMRRSATTLDKVVVKASYIQRQADRILLNVAGNPLAQGKDVKELLKMAPGVWATDDALSIYGQSGTTVYVNDRKVNMSGSQLMQYLRTMPSSLVARIEVIPYAGAEYSADSPGGIIRIITRKRYENGVLGSVGTSLTAGAKKLWANPSFNVSFHHDRLTLNLSGSVNGSPYNKSKTEENSDNMATGTSIRGISAYKSKAIQGNVLAGVFYELNGRNSIGLEFEYVPNYNRTKTESQSSLVGWNEKTTTVGKYNRCDNNRNSSVRLNYSYKLDSLGSSLKLVSNYNWQKMSGNEDNSMAEAMGRDSLYRMVDESIYKVLTTELKLEKFFANDIWLNMGCRHTMNDVSNLSTHSYLDGDQWRQATEYGYDGNYRENILAGWATASLRLGKWRAKAGLRYEYFKLGNVEVPMHYSDFFPNANLSYSISKRGDYSVSLGYYRYISRPSFWSLNPTVRQISDYSYTVGNPDLRPSYSNSVSLDFILANRYTVALGYSKAKDVIHQMFVENPVYPERMYFTWGNDGEAENFFIHADGNTNLTQRWNLYVNATYVINSQKGNAESSTFDASYAQVMASTTYSFPSRWYFTVNCFYMSKMRTGNIQVYPTLNVSPSVSKQFGSKWNASLSVENLLQRKSKVRAISASYDRLRSTKSYAAMTLTISYNFSSGKQFRKPRMENNIDSSRFAHE